MRKKIFFPYRLITFLVNSNVFDLDLITKRYRKFIEIEDKNISVVTCLQLKEKYNFKNKTIIISLRAKDRNKICTEQLNKLNLLIKRLPKKKSSLIYFFSLEIFSQTFMKAIINVCENINDKTYFCFIKTNRNTYTKCVIENITVPFEYNSDIKIFKLQCLNKPNIFKSIKHCNLKILISELYSKGTYEFTQTLLEFLKIKYLKNPLNGKTYCYIIGFLEDNFNKNKKFKNIIYLSKMIVRILKN
ncbi:hypothetical protein ACWNYH_00365 [Candidatus Vidania fulgoroideorum]